MYDQIIHITFSVNLALSFLLFIVGSLKLFIGKGPVSISLKMFSGVILFCMLGKVRAIMMAEPNDRIRLAIGQFLVFAAIGLFTFSAYWLSYNTSHQLSPISVKSAPKNIFQKGP